LQPVRDKFSSQAHTYAKFRPTYPAELYAFLFSSVRNKSTAWDCGTGNGQVAIELAKQFSNVYATDVSEKQLSHAPSRENIAYFHSRAEHTHFPDDAFDLITVAQAIHWFDFDAFYSEVRRVAKPDALLAVWGYGLTTISPEIDALVFDFYTNVVGKYWDVERRHIDDAYKSIPFPFRQVQTPEFNIAQSWKFEHFIGYLNSWSAVQNCLAAKQVNPVEEFKNMLEQRWNNDEVKLVLFPIFTRIGYIHEG